jgi:hypothetical protein
MYYTKYVSTGYYHFYCIAPSSVFRETYLVRGGIECSKHSFRLPFLSLSLPSAWSAVHTHSCPDGNISQSSTSLNVPIELSPAGFSLEPSSVCGQVTKILVHYNHLSHLNPTSTVTTFQIRRYHNNPSSPLKVPTACNIRIASVPASRPIAKWRGSSLRRCKVYWHLMPQPGIFHHPTVH